MTTRVFLNGKHLCDASLFRVIKGRERFINAGNFDDPNARIPTLPDADRFELYVPSTASQLLATGATFEVEHDGKRYAVLASGFGSVGGNHRVTGVVQK